MTTMLRRGATALVLIALGAGAAGCGDDKKDETAPTLPPAQSMAIDVSFFTDNQEAPGAHGAPAAPLTTANFANAAARVVVIDAAFTLIMTLPSAAFAAALSTPSSRDDDGSWWWIYTWRNGGQDHQVRLRGERDGGWVDWEMYLVRPGQSPWLWYSGTSATDGTVGDWTFYDFVGFTDREVATLDWEYLGPQDAYIGFTVTDTAVVNVGDSLTYTVAGGDRGITFSDDSADETWTIAWNTATHEGSLRVPGYNGGVKACWDGDLQDVACP